ncbi:ATP-dependent DNA ligase [Actinocatenispora rupis]|uniref:ATP-dependent DNA ligase n=1 Tax=Actinocatenispora rupis TaxID=519421 RepID=UPI001EF172C3|nr:ATP-dependent DNA ligase [Actinocatenispora rupis]
MYEPKWDGWRTRAIVDEGRLTVRSRAGRRLERYLPDLARVVQPALPDGTCLDGEVVAWSAERERTDFGALQRRLVAGHSLNSIAVEFPAVLVAFDLLTLAGDDLRPLPLRERRRRLVDLLDGAPDRLVLCPQTTSITEAQTWVDAMGPLGIEGLVIKPAGSPYRAGRRSGWRKWRAVTTSEAIVGGLTGSRARPDTLLLGRLDLDGRLRLAGQTTHLPAAVAAEIAPLLHPPSVGRQHIQHPWPQPLPAGWLGRWGGQADPLPYRQTDPTLVVEVSADRAYEHGRWRHNPRALRARLDLSPFDVPPFRWDEP